MPRGHGRIRQNLLPRHEADDPGEAEGHLGHLRVVPPHGRAGGRAQRQPHHARGAGPVGGAARGHLRGAPRGRHRRRAVRHPGAVPGGHPALPRHGGRHAHGPGQAALRKLRRAVRVLLPRGGHRGADVHAHHGLRRRLRGGPGQGVPGGAQPGPRQPAHQHPARRGRGHPDPQPHLRPHQRAGGVRDRRVGDRARHACQGRGGGRAVEALHAVPDSPRARGVRGGGGGRQLPAQGCAVAGVERPGRVPQHPGRHRGQRLRQLQQARLRAQAAEVRHAAHLVHEGADRAEAVNRSFLWTCHRLCDARVTVTHAVLKVCDGLVLIGGARCVIALGVTSELCVGRDSDG
mmetsp:Transcript_40703/g.100578  ORF Transcript_40703/g.100578 Transcript_40703/m.100578 type:complete len:347 (-) Transcript_40703:137-1177(-)